MTELRFHRGLYDAGAVEEAMRAYEAYAALARRDEGDLVVVTVNADAPERERQVAGELGNAALGLTVRRRGAR